ncbi:uncharacterized protein LOC110974526 [Acanthaster planci]|uniref:Uncharacterized protein LOC110974526 n=1 Tax=Acanthaster planci TaxID=133434 RepID=A0A8B7XP43_ACAPL|nr:uncharacterized protein LOC110974526 [Acanthaster planci]
MAWEEMFQMFPDGFPFGDGTFPSFGPGDADDGDTVPVNEDEETTRPEGEGNEDGPGDEGPVRPGPDGGDNLPPGHGNIRPDTNGRNGSVISTDRDIPWQQLLGQFFEWLEAERDSWPWNMNTGGNEEMMPGTNEDESTRPRPSESDMRPGDDGEVDFENSEESETRSDDHEAEVGPGNEGGEDDEEMAGDHDEETTPGGTGGETSEEAYSPLEGVTQLIGLVSGRNPTSNHTSIGSLPWQQLFDLFPGGVPFADGEISVTQFINVFPRGLPDVGNFTRRVPLSDVLNNRSSERPVQGNSTFPWIGAAQTSLLGVGDRELTWEALYQRLPNGLPIGNEVVPWDALLMLFPNGPPIADDESGDGWTGQVPQNFLNLGDGSVTWEDLFEIYPNGVPAGDYVISWEVLFTIFPNGLPLEDGGTSGEPAVNMPRPMAWTGMIPSEILDLGDGSLTWEQLQQQFPDGIPLGNETITWEVLFMMFPDGPPVASYDWSWLVSGFLLGRPLEDGNGQENPNPGTGAMNGHPWEDLLDVILTWLPSFPDDWSDDGGTPNDNPGNGGIPGVRPPSGGQWSGLIPTGLFDFGNGSETWEQLVEQIPGGLPFDTGNIPWETLFSLFPSGLQPRLEEWPWSLDQMFTGNNGMPPNMGGVSEHTQEQLRPLIQMLLEKLWSGEILIDMIVHFQAGEIPWQDIALIFPNGISFGDITVPWQELIDLFGGDGYGGMSGGSGHEGMMPKPCLRFPFGEFIPRHPYYSSDSGGSSSMSRGDSSSEMESGSGGMMPGSGEAVGMMPGGGEAPGIVPGSGEAGGMMPGNGEAGGMMPGSDGVSNMMPAGKAPTEGDMVYFFCQPGYKLIGSPSITCSCDGTWNGLSPRCKAITKPTVMPDNTTPFAEFTTLDSDDQTSGIFKQELTTINPFKETTSALEEVTMLGEMEFSTTIMVDEVTEDSSEHPNLETDEPKGSMTSPTVQQTDSKTQAKELTTSPNPKLQSTDQPGDPTISPQPKLQTTVQPSDASTSPQQKTQTSLPSNNPTTVPPGESQSTSNIETTNNPCSSNPCAEKANSQCVTTDQGAFACSCLPQFFESDGQCEPSQSFSGTLRITQIDSQPADFTEELQDPSSETFKSMAASMEKTIDSIYLTSSPAIAERYLGSTVLGFKNGSIVVDYIAHLNNTQDESTDDPTVLESAFEEAYMKSTKSGSLNITVDVAASTVTDLDECALSDTNDCSSNATCINLPGSFTCQCHAGFQDVSATPGRPGRSCTVSKPSVCSTSNVECSRNATCYDTDTRPEGYSCQCRIGFADRSPQVILKPGRICEEFCPSSNCFNGGSCVNIYETGEQICSCPDGYTGLRCEEAEQTGLSDTLILVISLTSVASLVIICVGLLLCFTFYHRQTKKNIKRLSLRSYPVKRDLSRFVRDEEVWDPITVETRSQDSRQSLVRESLHQDDYLRPGPSSEPRHLNYPNDIGEDNPDFIEEEFESQSKYIADAMSKLPEVERRMRKEVRSLGNYNFGQEPDYRDNFVRPYMAPEVIPIDQYLQDPRRYKVYDDESRGYGYGRPKRPTIEHHHGNRMSLQQDLRGSRMYLPNDNVAMPTQHDSYPMEDFSSPRQSVHPTAQYPPASRAYLPPSKTAIPLPQPPPPPPLPPVPRN